MPNELLPAAEFQSLPLEFIISAPLSGAIKAQAIAADTARKFIEAFKDTNVEFTAATVKNGVDKKVKVQVPLLSMVPVPHLRIDSLTVDFKYEIAQIVADKKSLETGFDMDVGSAGILSNFVKASIK